MKRRFLIPLLLSAAACQIDTAPSATTAQSEAPLVTPTPPTTPGAPTAPAALTIVPKADLDRVAYVAIATAASDAQLDMLAGVGAELAAQSPALTTADYADALARAAAAIRAHAPDARHDLSGHETRYIERTLARAVAALGADTSPSAGALRGYARRFLAALRSDVDEIRKVSQLDSLQDQYGAGLQFKRERWESLHAAAGANPAFAAAVDASAIGQGVHASITDAAGALVAAHPIEPLRSFVTAHARPDGSLAADSTALTSLASQAGAVGYGRAQAFANVLFDLNAAEQVYLKATAPPIVRAKQTAALAIARGDSPIAAALFAADAGAPEDAGGPQTPEDILKAAIDVALKKQQDLAKELADVKSGVSGGFWVAEKLATWSGDAELAADLAKLDKVVTTVVDDIAKYSKSAIEDAGKIAKIFDLGKTGAEVVGAAIFTGGMVAAVFEIASMFGSSGDKGVNQQILSTLKDIRDLITKMRTEMADRFDRIDRRLDEIYDTMMSEFALMDWNAGTINANVVDVQRALYTAQASIDRLDRDMYAFMDATERASLVEGIDGLLGYRARTGADMPYTPTFVDGENLFYTWAYVNAKDGVQAGPVTRAFGDDAVARELTSYPLATNVNYLSAFPAARLGLAPLASARLANPRTWVTSAESYAQLAEEWPAHHASIGRDRLARVQGAGIDLATALDAAASGPLFQKVAELYAARTADLTTAVGTTEAGFLQDPHLNLYGIDAWGGPRQVPSDHGLKGVYKGAASCSGGALGNKSTFDVTLAPSSASLRSLASMLIANNFANPPAAVHPRGTLFNPCFTGHWELAGSTPLVGGFVQHTYRFTAVVRVSYAMGDPNDPTAPAKWVDVYDQSYPTTIQRTHNSRGPDSFDPNAAWGTEINVTKDILGTASTEHRAIADAKTLADSETITQRKLVGVQRRVYQSIAGQFVSAGTPVAIAANGLDGAARLSEAYVALGLPMSLDQNDYLRSQVYGDTAILKGSASEGDGVLASIENLYRYMSQVDPPPATDPRDAIFALAKSRSDTLAQTVAGVLADLAAANETEGRSIVEPTMLRLQLLAAPTP